MNNRRNDVFLEIDGLLKKSKSDLNEIDTILKKIKKEAFAEYRKQFKNSEGRYVQ